MTTSSRRGLIPDWPGAYPTVQDRLDALDDAGLIAWPEQGDGMPRLKRYLDSTRGTAVEDVSTDIGRLEGRANEKVGYPTQKPLALLERIIKASSNEGDTVLDPFAGCATACVAADRLARKWMGIDLSPKATELVNIRLRKTMGSLFHHGYVTARSNTPQRTDLGKLPPYQSHKPILYGEQGGNCAGCGVHFLINNLTVDHIVARNRGGWTTSKTCNCSGGTATQSRATSPRSTYWPVSGTSRR